VHIANRASTRAVRLMHRRKALLQYTGERTGVASISAGCVSQVQVMAASPVVRAGRCNPAGTASLYNRTPVRDGREAAMGPLEPFHSARRLESRLESSRLESAMAEADAWVGRRVRTRDLHSSTPRTARTMCLTAIFGAAALYSYSCRSFPCLHGAQSSCHSWWTRAPVNLMKWIPGTPAWHRCETCRCDKCPYRCETCRCDKCP
jgi:hypothetical protein